MRNFLYDLRTALAAIITGIYSYEEYTSLPQWFQGLVDRLDPSPFLAWEPPRLGWDPAAVTKRVVFEDGEWWCHTTTVPDVHAWMMAEVYGICGIPKHMMGNL